MEPNCDHGHDNGLASSTAQTGHRDNIVSMDLTLAASSSDNMDLTVDPFGEEVGVTQDERS